MCATEPGPDDPRTHVGLNPCIQLRRNPEFSSAFLLACAGVAVVSANLIFEFGESTTPALIFVLVAILLSMGGIARSSPEARISQPSGEESAIGPAAGGSRRLWLIFVALILAHGLTAVILAKNWVPLIDTLTFQRDVCSSLAHGIDPFVTTHADIYGSRYPFYSPEVVLNGRVQVGFQYPPLTFLCIFPGYLLGDVRYGYIFAVLMSAWFTFAMFPNLRSLCICGLLLLNPLTFYVEMKGWTEPLVLMTLCATLYAAVKKRRWFPVALGLFLASKQYNIVVLPLVACLIHPFRWKSYAKTVGWALVVAAVTMLPFAIWNFRALWHDLVLFHLAQPFRQDALSFAVAYPWFLKVGPVLVLTFAAWAARAGMRSTAMFAAGYGTCLLLFFSTGKQAFCNYYFLIAQAFLLAAAALPDISFRPRVRRNAADGFSTTEGRD